MTRTTTEAGRLAEDRALDYLRQQGLILIERNARSTRGEIDLVMREGRTLVFVEVRQRSSMRFGGAAASITAAKRRRMWRSAEAYLLRHGKSMPCRFDAVCIDGDALVWLRHILSA